MNAMDPQRDTVEWARQGEAMTTSRASRCSTC